MRIFTGIIKILAITAIIAAVISFAAPQLIPGWVSGLPGFIKKPDSEKESRHSEHSGKIGDIGRDNNESVESDASRGAERVGEPDAEGQTKSTDSETFLTSEEVSGLWQAGVLDKLECLSILRKVSNDDLQRVCGLLEDGVTNGEMQEITGILGESLNEKDIQRLTELLEKNRTRLAQK